MAAILSVGQCGYDDSRISQLVKQAGFTLERALSAEDAREKLAAQTYALVLVNRVFDADGDSGVELIGALRGNGINTPAMLVSDYGDAQAKAIANGAVLGFGKSSIGDPQVVERIKTAALQE